MFDNQVDNCIRNLFDLEEVFVQPYSRFPYGRKVIDDTGGYIVFFYDIETTQVTYFLKETEESWFRWEDISFVLCEGSYE